MVFGLSLNSRRRTSKVPDLSRYDYHYNKQNQYYNSHDLSADAAYAASMNSVSRAQSMVYSSRPLNYGEPATSRTLSLRSGYSNVPRSYSMMGSTAAASNRRVSSVNNRSARNSRANSLANGSVIIKTQEVKDMTGRTQSITRQTIRRVNGMEYVETTTQTNGPLDDPQLHFQQFSNDENDTVPETPSLSPNVDQVHSFMKNEETVSRSESLEEFADASDTIESEDNNGSKKIDINNIIPSLTSNTGAAKPASQIKTKTVSKLRKDTSVAAEFKDTSRGSAQAFSTNPSNDVVPEEVPHLKPVVRRSTMSKRMTLREEPKTAPETSSSSHEAPTKSNSEVNKVRSSKGRQLTEEEMYAMALEIAKQKYSQSNNNTEAAQRNEMTPILEDIDPEIVSNHESAPHKLINSTEHETNVISIEHETNINSIEQENNTNDNIDPSTGPKIKPESKKKVKSIFDKIVQFSQENSGYQPPKPKHRNEGEPKNRKSSEPHRNSSSPQQEIESNNVAILTHEPQPKKKRSFISKLFGSNKT